MWTRELRAAAILNDRLAGGNTEHPHRRYLTQLEILCRLFVGCMSTQKAHKERGGVPCCLCT